VYALIEVRPNDAADLYLAGAILLADALNRDAVSQPYWPRNGTLFAAWALPRTMTQNDAVTWVKMTNPDRVLVFTDAHLLHLDARYTAHVACLPD
jgi:hypothetical protein